MEKDKEKLVVMLMITTMCIILVFVMYLVDVNKVFIKFFASFLLILLIRSWYLNYK